MAVISYISVLCYLFSFLSLYVSCDTNITSKSNDGMSQKEKMALREEARDMFYHAYSAYMDNAYPADELMPLTCAGRWRSPQTSRGDIDDTLGNFSLTLIDTLDTLAILGDLEEFEHAAKLISDNVNFDSDIVVSVFETNIRVLGGLLSGHVLAEYFKLNTDLMQWYTGQLLELAKDIGFRLLPAFNTTTGIPHGRINLRHGLKTTGLEWSVDTCTACAGTMILEMAALSRLTGEPLFEEKAHRAMDGLWRARNRDSDLMGTVLNVHSGDWIRRDSGVGAGIDSYYEYCLKAYVLLGEDKYLSRFDKHYSAVMKYISRGPLLLDVHMHKPQLTSRNFMDALLAFWPGLQVLKGDIKPAVETHEMLYQVMQRHNFIPEAFTTDFQVHWGQHPLRPEFLESTYFLHKATGDPHYLDVGKKVLRALQKYARVPCGYAAMRDVRTGSHEDRMDSFVLAETFKYLYLLFSEEQDLPLNLNEFIFTTEAHLLPLSLGLFKFSANDVDLFDVDIEEDEQLSRHCPSTLGLFPHTVREPIKNLVSDKKCSVKNKPRKLTLHDFQPENPEHRKILQEYGLTLETYPNGTFFFRILDKTASKEDAEESQMFIQELRFTTGQDTLLHSVDTHSQAVSFFDKDNNLTVLSTGSAQFGKILNENELVTAKVRVSDPTNACSDILNEHEIKNNIVLADRGSCMFVEKARRLQAAGAVAVIIIDNVPDSSSKNSPFFLMSSDGNVDDIDIPVVFLYTEEARVLMSAVGDNPMKSFTVCNINVHKEKIEQQRMVTTQIKIQNTVKHFQVLEKSNQEIIDSKQSTLSNQQPDQKDVPTTNDKEKQHSGNTDTLQLVLKSIIVHKKIENLQNELKKMIKVGKNIRSGEETSKYGETDDVNDENVTPSLKDGKEIDEGRTIRKRNAVQNERSHIDLSRSTSFRINRNEENKAENDLSAIFDTIKNSEEFETNTVEDKVVAGKTNDVNSNVDNNRNNYRDVNSVINELNEKFVVNRIVNAFKEDQKSNDNYVLDAIVKALKEGQTVNGLSESNLGSVIDSVLSSLKKDQPVRDMTYNDLEPFVKNIVNALKEDRTVNDVTVNNMGDIVHSIVNVLKKGDSVKNEPSNNNLDGFVDNIVKTLKKNENVDNLNDNDISDNVDSNIVSKHVNFGSNSRKNVQESNVLVDANIDKSNDYVKKDDNIIEDTIVVDKKSKQQKVDNVPSSEINSLGESSTKNSFKTSRVHIASVDGLPDYAETGAGDVSELNIAPPSGDQTSRFRLKDEL